MHAIRSTFRSDQPSLQELLDAIHHGRLQLPDFQRGWVWDDNHIRSLIASISLSYPIGAVMFLQTGGDGVRFRPRPVEGVEMDGKKEPEHLILDGQQRLTSLYLALRSSRPVKTRDEKGKEVERLYYLDIEKCLNPEVDREDAVISVPADRRITSDFGRRVDLDLTSEDDEHAAGHFPLLHIFDSGLYSAWRRGFQRLHRTQERQLDLFDEFEAEIIHRFQQYRVPAIELLKNTPKEAVCQVFEKVNTGGVALTVFELMTATFAADDYPLREDWEGRRQHLAEHEPLLALDESDFLTTVTLVAAYRRSQTGSGTISCKRKDILRLTLDEYRSTADAVEEGLIRAARLLMGEKIFDAKNLPYKTQLIPLGAICTVLGAEFEHHATRLKLLRWYWCGVFGELYGGANESRFAFDLPEVVAWCRGAVEEPRSVRDANFSPTRLLSLQSRQSAAYKGLMVLLMQVGSRDFLNGDAVEWTTYFDRNVDIHHIFPRAWCEAQELKRLQWNSIINKAPLTTHTNRILGGRSPATYLDSIERNQRVEPQRLDEILESHLITPELLRTDAFSDFLRDRATRLLDLIDQATGKQLSGRDSEETLEAFGAPLVRSARHTLHANRRVEGGLVPARAFSSPPGAPRGSRQPTPSAPRGASARPG